MTEARRRSLAVKVFFQPKCPAGEGDEEGREEEEGEREQREESGFRTNAGAKDAQLRMRIQLDDRHFLGRLREYLGENAVYIRGFLPKHARVHSFLTAKRRETQFRCIFGAKQSS